MLESVLFVISSWTEVTLQSEPGIIKQLTRIKDAFLYFDRQQ